MMSDKTSLPELDRYFIPARQAGKGEMQRVTLVPSLLPGETIEQAIKRRAETAARIEAKMKGHEK